MSKVVVLIERCKSCELCVHFCPQKCLKAGEEINANGYRYVVYEGESCKGCGLCGEMCPDLALQVYKSQ